MDNIFAYFIPRGDMADAKQRLAYASWFTDSIPESEFESDEQLFWHYLTYSVDLGSIVNFKYFQIWIDTELRRILHKTNVRVVGCETLRFEDPSSFETAVRTTTEVLLDDYKVLETQTADLSEFKVAMSAYLNRRKNARLLQALANTYDTLNATDNAEDAATQAVETITIIKDIYDPEVIEEISNTEDEQDTSRIQFVSDCGLPAIDKDSGGIFTKQLLGVEAQPGTGKTRFVLGTYLYRAATVHKKNSVFYALEQDKSEIEAMLVACHTWNMFNIQVSDSMILKNVVPEELKPQVEAARFDLFKSGKYGKIEIQDIDLYVETFITKIKTIDRLKGPFDLVVIDYMGLIDTQPAEFRKPKNTIEIIQDSYRLFKKYVRRYKKAGIAIGQFNREGIQAGKADKEITTDMAQGGIAVYRNTDYNIAISMTDTMKLQQKRRFSQPKVRSSAGFGTFVSDTRLGFLYFKQIVQKEVL